MQRHRGFFLNMQVLGNRKHGFFVGLVYLAVVGENAVDLIFHIGNLGVDGAAQTLGNSGYDTGAVELFKRALEVL